MSDRPPEVPGFDLLRPLEHEPTLWRGTRHDGLEAVIRVVALPDAEAQQRALTRYQRLAELVSSSPQTPLVANLGCGLLHPHSLWLATPLHPHGSLADLLRSGPLPETRVLRFGLQAAHALRLLHAHGIVHGGIRPSKLLLADGENLQLVSSSSTHGMDEDRHAFLAPEFEPALAQGPSGLAMDLYSLGATLYTCLVGEPPPPGGPNLFALERLDVRRPFQALLDRLLDLDPSRRLADVGELIAGLQQLLGAPPPSADLQEPTPTASSGLGTCGRYQLLEEIARGGMGVVFRARHGMLGRCYAIKRLLFGKGASKPRLRRFLREARTLARLRHPGIVAIHEVDFADGHPYLVMDLVEGGSLAEQLEQDGPWQPRRAASLLLRLAAAMDHVHAEGIVHRDLKPANILIEADGQPRISDFGIAADLGSDEGLTHTGAVLGTLTYMSPEQVEGRNEEVGPQSDIYSLGAILYELLVGRPPFAGTQRAPLTRRILGEEPAPPERLRPGLPRDLGAIACCALAKEPARRYPNAAALAADLQRFLAGQPVLARPVSRVQRAWLWARRHPVPFSAALGLLLLAIALVSTLAVLAGRERRDRALQAERTGLEQLSSDPSAARAALERALALDDSLFGAQRALGRLLLSEGEPDAALPHLRRAAELAADDQVPSLLGQALEALADHEGARAAYRQALARGSGLDDRLRLARLLLAEPAGAREAVRLLGEVLAGRPQDAEALRLRLRGCEQLGMAASAEDARWRLLALAPDDPAVLPAFVSAWLQARDGPSLARGWQAVHRRADPNGTHSLTRVLEFERAALRERALDAQTPPGVRLRAILALSRFAEPDSHTFLAELCEASALSPVLREAAWASRLCVASEDFPSWVTRAVAIEHEDGALQALTLAELWRILPRVPAEQLERLREARGWRLRAALGLTLGLAGGLDRELQFDAADGLTLLAADADARVRACAVAAQKALAIVNGQPSSDESADELAFAFALARISSGELSLGVARCRRRLLQRLEEDPDPALRLLTAREQIAAGDWLAATPYAAEAASAIEASQQSVALSGLLQLLIDNDSSGLAALRAHDPVAAARAETRARVARRFGVLPLPGPAGSTVLAFDLTSDSALDLGQAFELFPVSPPEPRPDGLSLLGSFYALSRFACDELYSCTLLAEGTGGIRVDGVRFRQVGILHGFELTVDKRAQVLGDREASNRPGARQAFFDRHGFYSARGGKLIQQVAPFPRETNGSGQFAFSLRQVAPQRHTLQQLRLVGYLGPTPPPLPAMPEPVELEPLWGAIDIISPDVDTSQLPASLKQLYEQPVELRVNGQWIGEKRDAAVFRIARVTGDFEIWTVVDVPNILWHNGGVAVTPAGTGFDAVRLEVSGPSATFIYRPEVGLRLQRDRLWEASLQETPSEIPSLLVLRRQGDWFTALRGSPDGQPEPIGPPIYIPMGDRVDLCLYGRGVCVDEKYQGHCQDVRHTASFRGTVVLVEADREP